MSSNVFELVLELLAIDPIRRSAIGALLRTGGGREWQRRVGYQTFVKASGNTRLLREPDDWSRREPAIADRGGGRRSYPIAQRPTVARRSVSEGCSWNRVL